MDLYTVRMTSPNETRNLEIAERRRSGETLDTLGKHYGMSRERVRQLCKRHGAFPSSATRKTKKSKRLERQDRRCRETWGISLSDYKRLRAMHSDWNKTPMGRYTAHRNGALHRGIEWRMTFPEWWDIWEASGKWEDRGSRKGQYVMARFKDLGPYSPTNVRIVTNDENRSEYTHETTRHRKPKARHAWGRNSAVYEGLLNRNVFEHPDSQDW